LAADLTKEEPIITLLNQVLFGTHHADVAVARVKVIFNNQSDGGRSGVLPLYEFWIWYVLRDAGIELNGSW